MKLRFSLVVLGFLFLASIASCQSMSYVTDPSMGVLLGSPQAPVVKKIDQTRWAHYLFWGMAPLSQPSLSELATQHAGPNEVVADLHIEEENSFANGLVAALTYGIYRPRKIHITGNVYRKEDLTP